MTSKHTNALDKVTALCKLSLLTMAWLSGILLFAKTRITVVSNAVMAYNVTAGVGAFHAAYVDNYLDTLQGMNEDVTAYEVLPYSSLMTASNLAVNRIYTIATEPISCNADDRERCISHLLPGGLMTSTPWPPTDHLDYQTITIHNAPATQVDFARILDQQQPFNTSQDCALFGSDVTDGLTVAIQFCLARDTTDPDSLLAGKWRVP
jgi:hypothetical protein